MGILVRWEETQGASEQAARLKHLGEVLRFSAKVFVGQDVKNGDHLMLGELESTTSEDPRLEESWEVEGFDKVPNLRAKEFLRTAILLPTFKTIMSKNGRAVGPVTYHHVTGSDVDSGMTVTQTTTTIEVPLSARGRPETKLILGEGEQRTHGEGRQIQTTVEWEIPKVYLQIEPSLEDWMIDEAGLRYDVLSIGEGSTRSAWHFVTRVGA